MIAKPKFYLCRGAAFVLLAAAALAQQQQDEPTEKKDTIHYAPAAAAQAIEQNHFAISLPGPEGGMFFSMGGKVVKGAPYSAEVITETSQVLGDGNRIVQKTSAMVYRDSDGRTRREQTIRGIGPWASGESRQSISINDPVAGVTYMLDPAGKTVRELVTEMQVLDEKKIQFKVQEAGRTASGEVAMGAGAVAGSAAAAAGGGTVVSSGVFVAGDPAAGTHVMMRNNRTLQGEPVTDSLGQQMVGGVLAEGSRTTMTIPAGAIGNERPIEITDEQWYSPDLQMMVMTVHDDPRFGRTVYQVTNINRSEPSSSLFDVPSEYRRIEVPEPRMLFDKKILPQ
jgi:hypothetical protein